MVIFIINTIKIDIIHFFRTPHNVIHHVINKIVGKTYQIK